MNYKIFFLSDNRSGKKTNEKYLKNNFFDVYLLINKYAEINNLNNLSFKNKIWHFINDKNSIPKCKTCDSELKFGRSLNEGYGGEYCSILCTNRNIDHINKSKLTWKKNEKNIVEKTKLTMLKKYGVDNAMKLDFVKNKFKEGSLKKYGVEYPSQSKKNQNLLFNKDKEKNIEWIEKNTIKYICEKCNNESILDTNKYNYRKRTINNFCLHCYPETFSSPQKEISDFLSEYVNVINNTRSIIKPLELDMYISELNIGIEFNGLYWHSELFIENEYHLKKQISCEKNGIKLIHIFEDEWYNKKEIVKSILLNEIKKSKNKIYARKCIIKEVSNIECVSFLNENHIQGFVKSKIKIGLYYDDELVSLMTFGSNRISLGNTNKKDEWELIRFCNKLYTNVIGGANKLFNYFIKKYSPNSIISYSDNRYFSGNLYKNLGFEYVNKTKISYYYVIKGLRYHRFNFRKDILIKNGFDKNKSEHEIMVERGIYRIYDCGNKKWIYNKKPII